MRYRGSAVCVATNYVHAGPGIEFLGPKKSPEQLRLGPLPESKSDVWLTVHRNSVLIRKTN